jgi:UDPglucose 6-dehydrogenase
MLSTDARTQPSHALATSSAAGLTKVQDGRANQRPLNVSVVGTGYVGLVTGTCLAETGHRVTCIDNDDGKIARLQNGEIPIYEPGLKELVEKNTAASRLGFTTNARDAIRKSDVVFIAVGTPEGPDGRCDLRFVRSVAETIAQSVEKPTTVVIKSTVPAGTADLVRQIIRGITDVPVEVVSNPETLKEGSAIPDFMNPDRIIIGTTNARTEAQMRRLYGTFPQEKIFVTNNVEAELIKLTSNAMLATRITFINQLAEFGAMLGADIGMVARGMGLDKRIGPDFLRAGPGYGGSCFPKDTIALVLAAEDKGVPLTLLRAVHDGNQRAKQALPKKVMAQLGEHLHGKTVAVLGLAFKPETDDMRESPAIDLIRALRARGATIHATDPEANATAKKMFGDEITVYGDPYEAIKGADALVIVTEWKAFKDLDLGRVKGLLKVGGDGRPVVIDGRNIFEPEKMKKMGFNYDSIGRPRL